MDSGGFGQEGGYHVPVPVYYNQPVQPPIYQPYNHSSQNPVYFTPHPPALRPEPMYQQPPPIPTVVPHTPPPVTGHGPRHSPTLPVYHHGQQQVPRVPYRIPPPPLQQQYVTPGNQSAAVYSQSSANQTRPFLGPPQALMYNQVSTPAPGGYNCVSKTSAPLAGTTITISPRLKALFDHNLRHPSPPQGPPSHGSMNFALAAAQHGISVDHADASASKSYPSHTTATTTTSTSPYTPVFPLTQTGMAAVKSEDETDAINRQNLVDYYVSKHESLGYIKDHDEEHTQSEGSVKKSGVQSDINQNVNNSNMNTKLFTNENKSNTIKYTKPFTNGDRTRNVLDWLSEADGSLGVGYESGDSTKGSSKTTSVDSKGKTSVKREFDGTCKELMKTEVAGSKDEIDVEIEGDGTCKVRDHLTNEGKGEGETKVRDHANIVRVIPSIFDENIDICIEDHEFLSSNMETTFTDESSSCAADSEADNYDEVDGDVNKLHQCVVANNTDNVIEIVKEKTEGGDGEVNNGQASVEPLEKDEISNCHKDCSTSEIQYEGDTAHKIKESVASEDKKIQDDSEYKLYDKNVVNYYKQELEEVEKSGIELLNSTSDFIENVAKRIVKQAVAKGVLKFFDTLKVNCVTADIKQEKQELIDIEDKQHHDTKGVNISEAKRKELYSWTKHDRRNSDGTCEVYPVEELDQTMIVKNVDSIDTDINHNSYKQVEDFEKLFFKHTASMHGITIESPPKEESSQLLTVTDVERQKSASADSVNTIKEKGNLKEKTQSDKSIHSTTDRKREKRQIEFQSRRMIKVSSQSSLSYPSEEFDSDITSIEGSQSDYGEAFKMKASARGIKVEDPCERSCHSADSDAELEQSPLTHRSRNPSRQKGRDTSTPESFTLLNPESLEFKPVIKQRKISGGLRPEAAEFNPESLNSSFSLNTSISESEVSEKLNTSMRADAPEFIPTSSPLPSSDIKPDYKKKKKHKSEDVLCKILALANKKSSSSVGIQISPTTVTSCVGTRHVKMKESYTLTTSCECRDVMVNTDESFGNGPGDCNRSLRQTKLVSRSCNTVPVQQRSVGINVRTRNPRQPTMCSVMTMTDLGPENTDEGKYRYQGDEDLIERLKKQDVLLKSMGKLQVELMLFKEKEINEKLHKMKENLKLRITDVMGLFTDYDSVEADLLQSMIRGKLTMVDDALKKVKLMTSSAIAEIQAGKVLEQLPDLTSILPQMNKSPAQPITSHTEQRITDISGTSLDLGTSTLKSMELATQKPGTSPDEEIIPKTVSGEGTEADSQVDSNVSQVKSPTQQSSPVEARSPRLKLKARRSVDNKTKTLNDEASNRETKETVCRETVMESAGRETVKESVGRETVKESVGRETVKESVGRETKKETVGRETVMELVGRETVNESFGRETMKGSVALKQESLSQKLNEKSGKTRGFMEIEDSSDEDDADDADRVTDTDTLDDDLQDKSKQVEEANKAKTLSDEQKTEEVSQDLSEPVQEKTKEEEKDAGVKSGNTKDTIKDGEVAVDIDDSVKPDCKTINDKLIEKKIEDVKEEKETACNEQADESENQNEEMPSKKSDTEEKECKILDENYVLDKLICDKMTAEYGNRNEETVNDINVSEERKVNESRVSPEKSINSLDAIDSDENETDVDGKTEAKMMADECTDIGDKVSSTDQDKVVELSPKCPPEEKTGIKTKAYDSESLQEEETKVVEPVFSLIDSGLDINPKEVYMSPQKKTKSLIQSQEVSSVVGLPTGEPPMVGISPDMSAESGLLRNVDPVLYQAVIAQLIQAYPELASNHQLLSQVALQQTGLLQMYMSGQSACEQKLTALEGGSPGLQAPGMQTLGTQALGMQNCMGQVPELQQTAMTQNSRMQAPGVQAPLIQAPCLQAPGIHAPGMQAPGIQVPEIQTPMMLASSSQAPVIQAPGIKATGMQAPTIQASGIQALGIQAPGMQASCIQAPGIQAAGIKAPAMQAPAIQASGMQAPGTHAPTNPPGIQAPLMQAPGIQAPLMQAPGIQTPLMQAPGIQAPLMQAPGIQAPLMQDPGIQAPLMQAPGIQAPLMQTSGIQAPLMQAPLTQSSRMPAVQMMPGPEIQDRRIPPQQMQTSKMPTSQVQVQRPKQKAPPGFFLSPLSSGCDDESPARKQPRRECNSPAPIVSLKAEMTRAATDTTFKSVEKKPQEIDGGCAKDIMCKSMVSIKESPPNYASMTKVCTEQVKSSKSSTGLDEFDLPTSNGAIPKALNKNNNNSETALASKGLKDVPDFMPEFAKRHSPENNKTSVIHHFEAKVSESVSRAIACSDQVNFERRTPSQKPAQAPYKDDKSSFPPLQNTSEVWQKFQTKFKASENAGAGVCSGLKKASPDTKVTQPVYVPPRLRKQMPKDKKSQAKPSQQKQSYGNQSNQSNVNQSRQFNVNQSNKVRQPYNYQSRQQTQPQESWDDEVDDHATTFTLHHDVHRPITIATTKNKMADQTNPFIAPVNKDVSRSRSSPSMTDLCDIPLPKQAQKPTGLSSAAPPLTQQSAGKQPARKSALELPGKTDVQKKTEEVKDEEKEEEKEVVEEWHEVQSKKKRHCSKEQKQLRPFSAPYINSAPLEGAQKSQKKNNFDRLIGRMQQEFTNASRQQIIDAIQKIREERGTLSGMSIEVIIEKAQTYIKPAKKKIPGLWVDKKLPEQRLNLPPRLKAANKPASLLELKLPPRIPASVGLLKLDMNPPPNQEGMDQCMNTFEAEICVICHDPLSTEPVKELDCMHIFHSQCISQWVERERTCPTCRKHALFPEEFPRLSK